MPATPTTADRRPRCWLVSSEKQTSYYSTTSLDPPEEWYEFAFVRARSKRRARVLAVKWWRRMVKLKKEKYQIITDGENPFRGMTVSEVTDRCALCGRLWVEHTDQQYEEHLDTT